ncbi:MAG TPA: protein-L-isoaspartate(D-aspartate) O-methyltransferase, partial [Gemmatimonadales bacterium]|nr:protein-L-isoaspartate(D-aspartate) O-methyltransferase [Gemmatimonadales bacterium]
MTDGFAGYRTRLVEELRRQGVEDLAILRAFATAPRHLFVPEALRSRAYEDVALPVGRGQTISQPSTQAVYLLSLQLQGHERVLEIGTGTGYQAALLSCLASQVFTVERIPDLATSARAALARARATNVTVLTGDGTLGWRPYAPYDAILVAAAGPYVPEPLVEQLSSNGRLIMPLETPTGQVLVRVTRDGSQRRVERLGPADFVPLIGKHG